MENRQLQRDGKDKDKKIMEREEKSRGLESARALKDRVDGITIE
jgi:hypothetical protein